MRTTMKGGVWKNSEDEILKAAVMKYGLNNWSRVASLLVRKSAKQCKSRWYEWLDPSVKKTEWTRDEEEKLLHLAKLFPNQWRTIAPIVGRTAHQCLDHYDKLLDRAQGRTEEDRLNDPRRLRPETKPSRADAVDMEDDEKEMLAEARARLANTRGKKAKRKAREKQLEEARRLAALQKRRELKAAGISMGRWRKRRNAMDYANEVPFEQQPPKGFFAVGKDETPAISVSTANLSLQQLEGNRRAEEEKRLRKEDTRKLKRMMEDNLPEAMKAIEKANEPANYFRKRSRLSLPEPQLKDDELDAILQLGGRDVKSASGLAFKEEATDVHSRQLLGDSSQNKRLIPQLLAPMLRTPLTQDTIMLEAQNAVARTTASTPLVGGETPALHVLPGGQGVTPAHTVPRTPNPLASEALKAAAVSAVAATPGSSTPFGVVRGGRLAHPSFVGGMTPANAAATPLLLGGETHSIGRAEDGGTSHPAPTPMSDVTGTSSINSKAMEAMLKWQVKASLAELPAPQNEVEVNLPDTSAGNNENESISTLPEQKYIEGDVFAAPEEDAEDVEKRREAEAAAERERRFRQQTLVIQRKLPRPLFPETAALNPSDFGSTTESPESAALLNDAELLLYSEMRALLLKDAVENPLPVKGLRLPEGIPEMATVTLEEMEAASKILQSEAVALQKIMEKKTETDVLTPEDTTVDADHGRNIIQLQKAWDDTLTRGYIFDAKSRTFTMESDASSETRLEAVKQQFEEIKSRLLKDSQKARKIQGKVDTITKGYAQRVQTMLQSIEAAWSGCLAREAELGAFKRLEAVEENALKARKLYLEDIVAQENKLHQILQGIYASLIAERASLHYRLNVAGGAALTNMGLTINGQTSS